MSKSNELPKTLRLVCPDCKRRIAPTPLQRVAVTVIRRTCQGCGRRWQVKVTPLKEIFNGQGWLHELEWLRL